MSEASFASLGPTLLARKGGAKPAMRPQLAPLPGTPAEIDTLADDQLEDLGWNDMGHEDSDQAVQHGGADIVSIAPSGGAANEDALAASSPVVKRQQRKLAERVLADAALTTREADNGNDDASAKRAKSRKKTKSSAAKQARRAAFTLRLDTDRHLKLRLAATMQGMSAQALVTEALDALLEDIDDLDSLVARMKRN